MLRNSDRLSAIAPTTTALAVAITAAATAVEARAGEALERFDVAGDPSSYVFDESGPLHEDGMPAHGNDFIIQGYIYPAGTLDDANGVLETGEPQFPNEVLGEWTCYGYFVGDGAHTEKGTWVITKQIYEFDDGAAEGMFVSEGPELADRDQPFRRAVTGGTGDYATFEGELQQTFLGFHEHGGPQMRFALLPAKH